MGLLESKLRKSGALVEIHRPKTVADPFAALVAGSSAKYVIVCLDHGKTTLAQARHDATRLASSSPEWCFGCAERQREKAKPRPKRRVGRKRTRAKYHF